MPVCTKCNCHNSLGTKICKKCNQALIQDEGKSCPRCSEYCGPFSQRCRKCGYDFTEKIIKNSTSKTKKVSVKLNIAGNNLGNRTASISLFCCLAKLFYFLSEALKIWNHPKQIFK